MFYIFKSKHKQMPIFQRMQYILPWLYPGPILFYPPMTAICTFLLNQIIQALLKKTKRTYIKLSLLIKQIPWTHQ